MVSELGGDRLFLAMFHVGACGGHQMSQLMLIEDFLPEDRLREPFQFILVLREQMLNCPVALGKELPHFLIDQRRGLLRIALLLS